MIYKSYCAINIEYYPFDIQDCYMKFGTWTHSGDHINLDHIEISKQGGRLLNENVTKEVLTDEKSKLPRKIYVINQGSNPVNIFVLNRLYLKISSLK